MSTYIYGMFLEGVQKYFVYSSGMSHFSLRFGDFDIRWLGYQNSVWYLTHYQNCLMLKFLEKRGKQALAELCQAQNQLD